MGDTLGDFALISDHSDPIDRLTPAVWRISPSTLAGQELHEWLLKLISHVKLGCERRLDILPVCQLAKTRDFLPTKLESRTRRDFVGRQWQSA